MVHVARVCWRRFKSALRLFKPLLHRAHLPAIEGLRPLLTALGRLRDLDVASYQTLPSLFDDHKDFPAVYQQEWARLIHSFVREDRQQRRAVRAVLQDPVVQRTLAAISQWLAELELRDEFFTSPKAAAGKLRPWAKRRVRQLHQRLSDAHKRAETAQSQHRTRILAKQLRYNIDMLHDVLPRKMTKDWYLQATNLQSRIGRTRDLLRASALARELNVPRDIAERLQYIISSLAET